MKEEILALTQKLVSIPSVNATPGEQQIGLFLEEYLRQIPYFQEHPQQIIIQQLNDDGLHRRNIFALLRGEKEKNAKTILFHGHTDTVGVEDYGGLKDFAFSPDALAQKLRQVELPEEVRSDLESGDYLFGRGCCDMKSGDAVFLVLVRRIAQHIGEFSGNILLSLNPVEENLHTGIIQGIDVLEALKAQYGLEYVLAINNDYTCPMYPGDPHSYLYTGVVGKLLPCFYIRGQETHVGQCYEGYDPNTIAAKLTTQINLNPAFCDGYQGEFSLPPVALKMKDLKGWYNVQTPKEAFAYFNYFVHNAQMDEIVAKLMGAASQAVDSTMKEVNQRYQDFCSLSGKKFTPIPDKWEVFTYQSLYEAAAKACPDLDDILSAQTQKQMEAGEDAREIPIRLIRILLEKANLYHPVVVLYFAAPYCPHNTIQETNCTLLDRLKDIVGQMEAETGLNYRICKFFPSLSDSSYLSIDDSDKSIDLLEKNFPQMNQLYPLPLARIKALNIPAVNFGVYGKDAHKWTERVHIPYSFEALPKLLVKALHTFLQEES